MSDYSERRNVLLGVSGSIAAYKSAELARLLISRGYTVQMMMTESAQEFVGRMTFEGITGRPVITDFFDGAEVSGIGHIQLADWAEAYVIAPATADLIAKLAIGLANCPLSTVALATKAPLVIAPAMNVNMWSHPATQANLAILRDRGVLIIDPEEGDLACGWQGTGRLADPWQIYHHIRRVLSPQDFKGKHILITTGPTREAIDPVRYLSNRSSGKMGVALAREAFRRGARVTLVHGPAHIRVPSPVKRVPVTTAAEMESAVMELTFSGDDAPDVVIMAAAVSDFRPKKIADSKIKKGDFNKRIELDENPDILAELGERRGEGSHPLLVGFAVETGELEDLIHYVRAKLDKKNCDLIVGNFADEAFDLDTNRVWIIDRGGRQDEIATAYKSRIANKILDRVKKFE
jgi:phosphopantothenoylcysteine decarboxylase/phosphopantothenate--cysteine ligase